MSPRPDRHLLSDLLTGVAEAEERGFVTVSPAGLPSLTEEGGEYLRGRGREPVDGMAETAPFPLPPGRGPALRRARR